MMQFSLGFLTKNLLIWILLLLTKETNVVYDVKGFLKEKWIGRLGETGGLGDWGLGDGRMENGF